LTSTNVRNIRNLGYTYPDLANSPSNKTLVANLKALYSGPADVPVTTTGSQSRIQAETASSFTKYFAQVKLPTYGLDDGDDGAAPYNVRVFLGDVSSDAKSWASSDNMIGLASTLGGAKMKNDQIVPILVDVTSTLNKAIENELTTSENAADYLKENLSYRVEIVSGLETCKRALESKD
jgi:tyrosinase